MEEVARARGAAHDAVDDITPARLRDVIDDHIRGSSMLPGVLTIMTARVVEGPEPNAEETDVSEVERLAAGVQLVYEGLRLTRTLVHDDPWSGDVPPNVPADVDVLAADVLVARGFHVLAYTDAAASAVDTVQTFGRRETDRQCSRESAARTLEASVFDLAAVAGAAAAGAEPPRPLRHYVVGLAQARERPLPPAADSLPETVEEVMRRVSAVPTADDSARVQSATDP